MTTLKEDVLRKHISPYFFETGTSNGEAVKLAIDLGFEKIFSVEIDEELYKQNIQKFDKEIRESKVFLFLGDSIVVLKKLLDEHIDKKCTFWLDAHVDSGPSGLKKCPLYEELETISEHFIKDHTIMIDDLRCFGGGWWGEGINLENVKNKLFSINRNYSFNLEDGYVENDILVAKLN